MFHFFSLGRLALLWTLLLLAGGGDSCQAESPRRPNILIILTDDQSFRTVGCYREEGAYDWVRTPNLDRLASRGVRFSHAYLGSWCVPSRFTALTGRQSYAIESIRPGLIYPRNTYDARRVTFWPSVFREHGYFTGMIGKWHTGKDAGFGREWDFQMVWNRPAGTMANASAYYKPQDIHVQGAKKPVHVEGYPADNYTSWAVDFIKDRGKAKGQPWALWLCYPNSHAPFTPAEENQAGYPDLKVPAPPDIFQAAPGKPAYVRKLKVWAPGENGEPVMKQVRTPTAGGPGLKGDSLSDWVRQYQQCVTSIDEDVGKLLAALSASGQEEETLVIFTSDQGFAMGQHGFAHKLAPYDANLRSPLIISQPGTVPTGRVCRTPVGGVDLVATLYAQARIEPPVPLDGHDLTPLIQHPESRSWNHPVVQSYTRMAFGKKAGQVWRSGSPIGPPVPWWTSVVDGHYKYVRTMVRGEVEELYDLKRDPEELVNLALKPGSQALLARMRTSLTAELERTGAPFADRMPPVGTEREIVREAAKARHSREATSSRKMRLAERVPEREPRLGLLGRLRTERAAKPEKRALFGLRS